MQFRRDIQGMRAIAVLAVFIFHLNPAWLPGGFIGVDIFFVISGYLISSIVLSRIERDKFSFLEFYGSRIKRITPAYYVMLFFVMLAVAYIAIPWDANLMRLAFKNSLIFNSNHYFSGLDTYFGAASAQNPFLHTWTLAIEMQFYLFLPFILFFVRSRKWLLLIIVLLTIGLFAYGSIEIFALRRKNEMYFSLLARAPEFLLGVIVALIPADKIKLKERGAFLISLLGLVLIIGSAIFITEHSSFPGILAVVPCVGAVLLILAPQNKIRSLLAMEAPFLIGDWSYSIYLWHWPIMALLRYYYDIEVFSFWQYIFVIVATIIFSLASYYLVEHPLRKTKGKVLYPLVGMLLIVCLTLVHYSLAINQKVMWGNEYESFTKPVFGLKSHNDNLQPDTFGDLSKKPNIFMLGNSHASNLKPYLDYIGKKNEFSFKTVSTDFYPPLQGIPEEAYPIPNFGPRYLHAQEVIKKEKLLDENKVIIIQMNFDNKERTKVFEKLLSENLKKLHAGQILILLSDFPTIDKNPVRKNKAIAKTKNGYQYKISDNPVPESIEKVINENPNAHILDLTDTDGYKKTFGDAPFYNDTIMYYDENHLNLYGSLKYAQETEKDFMHKLDSILSLHKDIKLNVDSVR